MGISTQAAVNQIRGSLQTISSTATDCLAMACPALQDGYDHLNGQVGGSKANASPPIAPSQLVTNGGTSIGETVPTNTPTPLAGNGGIVTGEGSQTQAPTPLASNENSAPAPRADHTHLYRITSRNNNLSKPITGRRALQQAPSKSNE